jgi:hypothetical protein
VILGTFFFSGTQRQTLLHVHEHPHSPQQSAAETRTLSTTILTARQATRRFMTSLLGFGTSVRPTRSLLPRRFPVGRLRSSQPTVGSAGSTAPSAAVAQGDGKYAGGAHLRSAESDAQPATNEPIAPRDNGRR